MRIRGLARKSGQAQAWALAWARLRLAVPSAPSNPCSSRLAAPTGISGCSTQLETFLTSPACCHLAAQAEGPVGERFLDVRDWLEGAPNDLVFSDEEPEDLLVA